MIHCPNGLEYGVGSFECTATLIWRQCINFPVAIFIFLAAYFVNEKKIEHGTRTYVLSRGGRLLIPFCVWSGFYILIYVVQSMRAGSGIQWISVAYKFMTGKAAAPLYYIVVLVQLTLLTPFLLRVIKKKGTISRVLWILTPAYLLMLYCFNILVGDFPRLYETFFPAWFLFYYLGLWLKARGLPQWIRNLGRIRFVGVALIFSLGEAVILISIGCSTAVAVSQIKVSSFLFAICVLMWLKNQEGLRKANNLLVNIGDCSYGIFYVHCFVLLLVKKALNIFGICKLWILYFVLTWILVSVISYVLVRIMNNIVGRRALGKKIIAAIGFR